jgi:hypothetical protein
VKYGLKTKRCTVHMLRCVKLCIYRIMQCVACDIRNETETQNGYSGGRLRLKCDGTRTETRFRLSAKRTSPFKSAGGVSSVDFWQPRCAHQR